MKKIALLVFGLLLGLGAAAYAADWGDSFQISVTPAGDRGVIIATTTFNVSLTLGTTTQWAFPVPVTSTGTLGDIEYTMACTGSANWTLSASNDAAANVIAIQGLFNATAPTMANFDTGGTKNLLTNAAKQVGDAATNFEGDQDLDNLALNAVRQLWLQFKAPTSSISGAVQNFTITVTAEAAN